jgi:hypothetical protein
VNRLDILGNPDDLVNNCSRCGKNAQTQTGADDLAERVEAHDAAGVSIDFSFEREIAARSVLLVSVVEIVICVIFEDYKIESLR